MLIPRFLVNCGIKDQDIYLRQFSKKIPFLNFVKHCKDSFQQYFIVCPQAKQHKYPFPVSQS